jgi:hypothetical protein
MTLAKSFVPFSTRLQQCIARNFAMMELTLTLANAFWQMDFGKPGGAASKVGEGLKRRGWGRERRRGGSYSLRVILPVIWRALSLILRKGRLNRRAFSKCTCRARAVDHGLSHSARNRRNTRYVYQIRTPSLAFAFGPVMLVRRVVMKSCRHFSGWPCLPTDRHREGRYYNLTDSDPETCPNCT